MTESLAQLSKGALSDLAGVFAAMPEDALDGLIEEIVKAQAHRRLRARARGAADARLRHAALSHGPRRRGLGRHDDAGAWAGRSVHRLRRSGRPSDRANPGRYRA